MPPYGQSPPTPHACEAAPGQQALVVRSFPLRRGSWFEEHHHPAHQLAWCTSGLLSVRTPGGTWLLPPSVALWIPAHTPHATGATSTAVLRSPYIAPGHCPVVWCEPTVVSVPPLLRELINHLAEPSLPGPARERAEGVLFDLLEPVPARDIGLTWPADPRARTVAEALRADLADSRPLAAWGPVAGASARTLARLFVAETGLGFGRWRERLRVQEAMPLLAQGRSVESVAHRVGYASASAFIAAFRRTVGLTPGQFFG
ncbi:AraC family transcriptional regulator [Streptomyces sp. NPDC053499]|uniref:AraC family transcriptional regulator n=1 Tax=Streptomyces sp. NPDC053499 TaxID=3365707 RepID=UPI0037D55ACB